MDGKTYKFRDKYGSATIRKKENILVVNFNGACGIGLSTFYIKSVKEIAPQFGKEKWGFLFNSIDYKAATPEADESFYKFALLCMDLGCRCDAFRLTSAVAIAQIKEMRLRSGNNVPLEDVLFDTEAEAKAYLTKALAKLKV